MKWGQIKKRVEGLLAEPIKGRVEFRATSYRRAHDQAGRGWITIDGVEILNMPTIDYEIELYSRGRRHPEGYEAAERELHDLNLFSQWALEKSLFDYLNLPIDKILTSDKPLIRAVGMLDPCFSMCSRKPDRPRRRFHVAA